MLTKISEIIVVGFLLVVPVRLKAQLLNMEILPFQILEKTKWEVEGKYNSIWIDRTSDERILCMTPYGNKLLFDSNGKTIQTDMANTGNISLKKTGHVHFDVYNATEAVGRITPPKYPFLSPNGQSLIVFPRAFLSNKENAWKISFYDNQAKLLWESAPPIFEKPFLSPDSPIPQIIWPPRFSPGGNYFIIGFQNQVYMYGYKGLVWKYKDPDSKKQFNYSKAVISEDGKKVIIPSFNGPSYRFNGKGQVVWKGGFSGGSSVWLDERYIFVAGNSGKFGIYDIQTSLMEIVFEERTHYTTVGIDYNKATGNLALLFEKSRSERGKQAYKKYQEAIKQNDDEALLKLSEEIKDKILEARLYEILKR